MGWQDRPYYRDRSSGSGGSALTWLLNGSVSLGGHHLRLYARSRTLASKIAVADSNDDGVTWTQARFIDVPNNNSGIDAVTLKDGRVVMIFNNTTKGRTPLNLAVTTVSWST